MKTLHQTFLNLHYFILVSLLSIVFLSCGNDDNHTKVSDLPICLSTLVDKKAASIETQLPSCQEIGVFFSENPEQDALSGKTYEPNLKYTADGNGGLSGKIQYYPENRNGIKISAYHPYNSNAEDEYIFTVNPDQTTNAKVYNSDLLYCPEFTQAKTLDMIKIKLIHKFSQIVFDLTSGENTPDLTDAQITLLNVYTSATFNRRTGEVSNFGNPQDVKLNKEGNGGIIVPQTIPVGTRFAKITLKNGTEMFYTTTSQLTLVENKKLTVNLKVNKTETVGIGTEVENWGDGGSSTGEAEEDNSRKLLPVEIVDEFFVRQSKSRYLLTYNSQNRVSILENWSGVSETPIHILTTFNYSTSGEIISFLDETINDNDNTKNYKELFECSYSEGRVNIKRSDLRPNPGLPIHYIINIDGRGNFISLETVESKFVKSETGTYPNGEIFTYDTNGNKICDGLFKYDNKINAVYYLNLPGWFLTYVANAKLCTGKNNLIERRGQAFNMEYNAEGYPIKMSYTKTVAGKPKDYRLTIKYKKWDE